MERSEVLEIKEKKRELVKQTKEIRKQLRELNSEKRELLAKLKPIREERKKLVAIIKENKLPVGRARRRKEQPITA